ncbi:hypothetical protein CC86DRAFT_342108 [Ophiobolus disseminans]|uniref:Uncharacterized protein n=1 Tax=Ophiobolus disseminans TaxID=1469910 RepID=A0A6A7ADG6_9PLEO|nr:hypothetical protein CC86DRAFT_342108 [Ophiobolus disseminans]
MSSTSDEGSRASSPANHENCPFHDDPRSGLCNALTNKGTLCTYKGKITKPGYFPVCGKHSWSHVRAGRCQTVEECGQLCDRFAEQDPPYHLCEKHQMGSNTLPCHLMRLPTELRFMIFRNLFPKVVASREHEVKAAILKTNRQINEEASSVLYGESVFEVYVQANLIEIMGKVWNRHAHTQNEYHDYSTSSMLCQEGLRMIRNLEVIFPLGAVFGRHKGTGPGYITLEEYELYAFRGSMRKLGDLFLENAESGSLHALRSLKITARSSLPEGPNFPARRGNVSKDLTEGIPTNDAYINFRDQWLKVLADLLAVADGPATNANLEPRLRKTEAFAQFVNVQAIYGPKGWNTSVFQELERPLHLARVAYENNNEEMMVKIQEAINLPWVNAYRQNEKPVRILADFISTMFEQEHIEKGGNDDNKVDRAPTLRELYPDAYQFGDHAPLSQPYETVLAHLWSDLDFVDPAPRIGSPGVTVEIGDLRYTVRKDGKEWARLKTPALIREMRLEK